MYIKQRKLPSFRENYLMLSGVFVFFFFVGWKPRRTIIFALWDAAKYGNIGAYEWAQVTEFPLNEIVLLQNDI